MSILDLETVYLSRHGQSLYNVEKKIGGNPGITEAGEQYAKWLGKVVPGKCGLRLANNHL